MKPGPPTIPDRSTDAPSAGLPLALLIIAAVALILSGINPNERFTWWLEISPVLIAAPVLVFTFRRFRFTNLVYILILVHALILILGGHYTYAKVPPGDWVRDLLSLERNPYDRLGHLAQGFIPAMIARELLIRKTPLRPGSFPGSRAWLFAIISCIALAISAFYELIEWWVSVATSYFTGEGAEAFLGTQGDIWDTQWDMLCALIGATLAQLLLARLHDRQLVEQV